MDEVKFCAGSTFVIRPLGDELVCISYIHGTTFDTFFVVHRKQTHLLHFLLDFGLKGVVLLCLAVLISLTQVFLKLVIKNFLTELDGVIYFLLLQIAVFVSGVF
jgi:hypothetical protein